LLISNGSRAHSFRAGFKVLKIFHQVTTFNAGSTLRDAWKDTVAHLPTLLLTWLASGALFVVGYVVLLVISSIFSLADDSTIAGFGFLLALLGSLPFFMLSSLTGVMFSAIPAIYYQRGEDVVSFSDAYSLFISRWVRYLMAGVLFFFGSVVGFVLCYLPGLIVLSSMPVYVNKVFTTDLSIWECFTSSFSSIYSNEKGWALVGMQFMAFMLAYVTCGFCLVGLIVYVPVLTFFLQLYISRSGMVRAAG